MASRTVRARLDAQSEAALSVLMREGRNESEAVRAALLESADRRRRRSVLAEEIARVARDAADLRARAEAMQDMDSVRLPWPE